MPPTQPTDKAIAKQLADVVRQIYNSPKRDDLTVNHARQVAETKLKLDDGFLKEGDWKAKSKQIIVDTLNELEAADTEAPEPAAPTPKKKAKPAPKPAATRDKKRAKKAPTPSDAESEISDVSDVEDAPAPPAKKRKLAKGPKGRSKVVSDDDNNSAASEDGDDQEPPKPAEKPRPKQLTDSESALSDVPDESPAIELASKNEENAQNDSSSDLSDVITVELPKRKQPSKPQPKAKPKSKPTKPAAPAEDDSSDLSSVLDDAPPPPKRKPSSKSKPTTTSKSTPDSPDEAQIKLLQSHLSKCGVRKIWPVEFKKHGCDTPKARIAHLRGLLADVGMTGRFSEARAREIKEMRELQADLQDVMQGEKSWGVGGGGRRTRGAAAQTKGTGKKGKGVVEEEGSEDGGDGSNESEESDEEEEDDEEGGKLAVRGKGPAKRRADLAFLDDESESE